MDEHTFMVNRERAVDYLNSLDKVPFIFIYLLIKKNKSVGPANKGSGKDQRATMNK